MLLTQTTRFWNNVHHVRSFLHTHIKQHIVYVSQRINQLVVYKLLSINKKSTRWALLSD